MSNICSAIILSALFTFYDVVQSSDAFACPVDRLKPKTIRFAGVLTFKVFPGSPNFEDIRKGDAPEPAYILRLDEAVCVSNMEVADEGRHDVTTSKIQLSMKDYRPLSRLRGQHVVVVGQDVNEAFTAHYHAPLMVEVKGIEPDREGIPGEAPAAQRVVQAFYIALGEGNGDEAAMFVLPERRRGAFSAKEMSRFYGALVEPLQLESVRPLNQSDFEVKYRYKAGSHRACSGHAVVSTITQSGSNYIASIRTHNGC